MIVKKNRVISLTLLLTLIHASINAEGIPSPDQCLQCHSDVVGQKAFTQSVHGELACTGCHREIVNLRQHTSGKIQIRPVQCESCHQPQVGDYYGAFTMGTVKNRA